MIWSPDLLQDIQRVQVAHTWRVGICAESTLIAHVVCTWKEGKGVHSFVYCLSSVLQTSSIRGAPRGSSEIYENEQEEVSIEKIHIASPAPFSPEDAGVPHSLLNLGTGSRGVLVDVFVNLTAARVI